MKHILYNNFYEDAILYIVVVYIGIGFDWIRNFRAHVFSTLTLLERISPTTKQISRITETIQQILHTYTNTQPMIYTLYINTHKYIHKYTYEAY